MKGERLFVERQTELLEHLVEEKDITIKFKLTFLKCFSELDLDLEAVCQDFGIAVSTGYLWLRTWAEVKELIRREFGIEYSSTHVIRI